MKESKFTIWVKGKYEKAKTYIGPVIACMIPGIIIGGSVTALRDSGRITKLEKKFRAHSAVDDDNVDKLNAFIIKTNTRMEELTRQNNELLERALRETEGKP